VSGLSWSWLGAPYVACAIVLFAVVLASALVRGDRVLRLGMIGAAVAALPWAICSAISASTQDADTALRLLRLGEGPVALVGPNLLLVLLGVSGQLERHRWVARLAGGVGVVLLAVCWSTDWTVADVQRLRSGMFYMAAGPLTDLHMSQLAVWLAIGLFIVRRASTRGEKRRLTRILVMVLALGGVCSVDVLLVHGIWGRYPVAWLPAMVAGGIGLYLVVRTDVLRSQGIDRGAVIEAFGHALAAIAIASITFVLAPTDPVMNVLSASAVWAAVLGVTWVLGAQRPVRIASDRALEQFVARLADVDDERVVVERLAALWSTIGVSVHSAWRADGETLVEIRTGARRDLDRELAAWLVRHGQAIAPGDLATMRLGELRPQLEALVAADGVTLVVPLIDRDRIVGLVEADHADSLREAERGLVAQSSRAAARALTYAALARAAAKENETAREVELAEAMRQQAAASRDAALGRWIITTEYRSAPRTTGASWSTSLLSDGRLAVLVTEAHSHGVPAALATATLTGAFAAATATAGEELGLDDLVASLGASTQGVLRGGASIAAFLAVLDAERGTIAWTTAGHPGGHLVGAGPPAALAGRGVAELPADATLVIASTGLRGSDEERWRSRLAQRADARALVEAATPDEDLLAVVIGVRPHLANLR